MLKPQGKTPTEGPSLLRRAASRVRSPSTSTVARWVFAGVLFTTNIAISQTVIESEVDPAKNEVPVATGSDWRGSLVYESDVGIWTVGGIECYSQYGCREVFGLDDRGRCTILVSYSGKWTPFQTVEDRDWLGALSYVDLDPRREGREIYTAGKTGNVYQIIAHDAGGFDVEIIARFPGLEIHSMVAGDLRRNRAGNELLIFASDGFAHEVRPNDKARGFDTIPVRRFDGRVRQALIVPSLDGAPPWIATADRAGKLLVVRLADQGIEQHVVADEPMGLGRVAMAPRQDSMADTIFYATRDDGLILRFEGEPAGEFRREAIYAGPTGPRGIACGRFYDDPSIESIALFGYSKRVELVSRQGDEPWQVETIFVDNDKGHWLEAVEIDGRNTTDELIASGYGKRIIALARPPGYGMTALPRDPVTDARSSTSR